MKITDKINFKQPKYMLPAILYIPSNGEEPVMTVGARGKEKFKEEIGTLLLQ
jgi:hypothetical protein